MPAILLDALLLRTHEVVRGEATTITRADVRVERADEILFDLVDADVGVREEGVHETLVHGGPFLARRRRSTVVDLRDDLDPIFRPFLPQGPGDHLARALGEALAPCGKDLVSGRLGELVHGLRDERDQAHVDRVGRMSSELGLDVRFDLVAVGVDQQLRRFSGEHEQRGACAPRDRHALIRQDALANLDLSNESVDLEAVRAGEDRNDLHGLSDLGDPRHEFHHRSALLHQRKRGARGRRRDTTGRRRSVVCHPVLFLCWGLRGNALSFVESCRRVEEFGEFVNRSLFRTRRFPLRFRLSRRIEGRVRTFRGCVQPHSSTRSLLRRSS